MKTLYLIRGIPGSGKSTLARDLWVVDVVQEVVEADDYFIDNHTGFYDFRADRLALAHSWCKSAAESCLSNGKSVAVSNTSTTEKEVKVYQELAQKYNAKFVSIICENRHNGANLHGVPEEKLQQMRNRFSIKL